MGLEFSFDEISLNQQASGEQLEIDLYDELVTLTDAEPDEQVRLLSVKPAVITPSAEDKPESIRVTGSLGKDPSASNEAATPKQIAAVLTETPAPRPNGATTGSLRGNAGAAAPPLESRVAPKQWSDPVQDPSPAVKPSKIPTPGEPVTRGAAPVPVAGPKSAELPTTAQPPAPPVPNSQTPARAAISPTPRPTATSATKMPGARCAGCGLPAGELDMICIECGAFIG